MTPSGSAGAGARSSQVPAGAPGRRAAGEQGHPSRAPATPLRVVSGEELAARRRLGRARIMIAAAVSLVVIACFSAIAAHAALNRGQLELDYIKANVSHEATLSRALAARAAALETPARLVQAAGRMGMVEPQSVTYVGSARPTSPRSVAATSSVSKKAATRAKPARSRSARSSTAGSPSARR